jgi:hypothetical protein
MLSDVSQHLPGFGSWRYQLVRPQRDFSCVPIIIALTTRSLTRRRVCEVVLNGDKTFSLVQQKYKVSDKLKSGEATALFGMHALGYL